MGVRGRSAVTHLGFLVVDAICATIVVGTFFWLSHFFGAWVGPLFHESQLAMTAIVLSVAAFVAIYYFAWRKYSKQLHLDEPPDENDSDTSEQDEPSTESVAGDRETQGNSDLS